jgi:hypothetical protein
MCRLSRRARKNGSTRNNRRRSSFELLNDEGYTGIEFHWGAAAGARRCRRLRNGAIARDWRHDRQNAPRRHGILHRALGRHFCAACPLFVAPNRSRSARARLPIAAMFIDEGNNRSRWRLVVVARGRPRESDCLMTRRNLTRPGEFRIAFFVAAVICIYLLRPRRAR